VSKSFWLLLDPRIYAVSVSLLISVFTIVVPDSPNDDAYLYIRTAEIFLSDGFASAFQHFPWASYSLLIASLSLLGFELFTAAYILNALFYGVLVYSFVSIVKQINPSRTVILLACVCILVYPQLNEYRYLVIRDIGFWAFSMLALWQFLLYAENHSHRFAIAFSTALLLAATFRAEALLYLVCTPIGLLFDSRFEKAVCRRNFVRLVGILAAAVVATMALFTVIGIDIYGLFLEFISVYQPFVDSLLNSDAAGDSEMSRVLFGSHAAAYSQEYLGLFLAAGLFAILMANLFNGIGGAFLLVLLFGLYRRQFKMPRSVVIPVALYLLVNIGILFTFLFITRYLSSRYAMLFCLLLALMVPVILAQLLTSGVDNRRRLMPLLLVFFSYCAIDSYYSFGHSKSFVFDSVEWIEENAESSASLLTNNHAIAYSSGMVENYDKIPRFLTETELLSTSTGDLIAIEMHFEMMQVLENESLASSLELLTSFSDEDDPGIAIYRRVEP